MSAERDAAEVQLASKYPGWLVYEGEELNLYSSGKLCHLKSKLEVGDSIPIIRGRGSAEDMHMGTAVITEITKDGRHKFELYLEK